MLAGPSKRLTTIPNRRLARCGSRPNTSSVARRTPPSGVTIPRSRKAPGTSTRRRPRRSARNGRSRSATRSEATAPRTAWSSTGSPLRSCVNRVNSGPISVRFVGPARTITRPSLVWTYPAPAGGTWITASHTPSARSHSVCRERGGWVARASSWTRSSSSWLGPCATPTIRRGRSSVTPTTMAPPRLLASATTGSCSRAALSSACLNSSSPLSSPPKRAQRSAAAISSVIGRALEKETGRDVDSLTKSPSFDRERRP